MPTVLITEPIDPAGTALLDRAGLDWAFASATDEKTLAREAADARAMIVRVAPVTAAVLGAAPHLRVVAKHGVGCDNIDVAHLSARNVPMAISAGANAQSVAEHTLALLLAAARRLREQDAAMRAGAFNRRHELIATDLHGARALVIGYGRVGSRVARLLRAFGVDVTVADIRPLEPEARAEGLAFVHDFREALPCADIVCLHVPLDASTAGMLDRATFARFKPNAVFVNCARGGVMDEAALEWALEHGPLAAAGVDVFTQEPTPADHPLFARDDIVVSPHTGAASRGAVVAMATMAAENVIAGLQGELLPERVFNLDALEKLDLEASKQPA